MAGHVLKRWLYLTHRWIGIVSCLFFAMWFASGLVMVYVPYPSLDREEWLAGQAAIDWQQVRSDPATTFRDRDPGALRELSLEMRGAEPVWRWRGWDGEDLTRSARDGREPAPVTRAYATALAEDYSGSAVTEIESLHNDQWTVANGYERHRPLWKASLAGDGGRTLYVSSTTGLVVLETTAKERFWNWLGSVPHWIYPTVLRQDGPAWRQVILWLSGPCIIAALTGIWIGILRVRLGKRKFKGGRITPYRGWMMWHHLTGLAGSLFLLLWIFSGWLSVDPGRFFESEGPGVELQQRYAGQVTPSIDLAQVARIAPEARRIELSSAAGRPYLTIEQQGAPTRYLDAATLTPPSRDAATIRRTVAALFPDNRITAVETLREPDAYWYRVRGELPLPVLRFKLDDRAETWLHVDPATGEVLGSLDRKGRLYRWMFDLFHRWDLNLFLDNWPSRDLIIWIFSLFGLASSVTGVWIGWKRLRGERTTRRRPRGVA